MVSEKVAYQSARDLVSSARLGFVACVLLAGARKHLSLDLGPTALALSQDDETDHRLSVLGVELARDLRKIWKRRRVDPPTRRFLRSAHDGKIRPGGERHIVAYRRA